MTMRKFKIFDNGTHVNTINASLEFVEQHHAGNYQEIIVDSTPSIESYEEAIQQHLDEEAKSQGYDNIMSACSYAGDVNRFQAQGKAAIRWRADVWTEAETIFSDVQAGNRTAPTIEELIAELPTITWPARS